MPPAHGADLPPGMRRTVARVAALNFGYFVVEFGVALAIGSVALFADSIDFLEDAAVNLLILLAFDWPPHRRAQLGLVLSGVLMVPGIATLWTVWQQITAPVVPAAMALSLAGLGALAVNLTCALWLARFRTAGGSLARAAFLSARNDAIANIAIILAGGLTAATGSAWPDLVTGLGIAAMNADAAREVWQAARRERRDIRA